MDINKYFLFVIGCQMNVNDSERLTSLLNSLNLKQSSEEEADLIVVVSCSVRQKALDRIWGKIRQWRLQNKTILVTGCVLKEDRIKLRNRNIKYIDIDDSKKIISLLGKRNFKLDGFFNIVPMRSTDVAYITIMSGCDNFCSYCAVPYTRGRELSRSMNDIVNEIERAINQKYKKLILLGQNVNSYGVERTNHKKSGNLGFINLLRRIDSLPYEFEFNFLTSNPHDMSDELIKAFANLKKWPKELHLAVQSGDDEILQKMNRKYSSSDYLELVSKLKTIIPNLKITTDIIVGFPGETKTQFNNTVKLCKKIKFNKAYVSQYSPRPGTQASKLKDDVSAAEKKRRWRILESLINK